MIKNRKKQDEMCNIFPFTLFVYCNNYMNYYMNYYYNIIIHL
jgi:hypothetical protein